MTEYLKPSFSVNMAGDDEYRANWERIFCSETAAPPANLDYTNEDIAAAYGNLLQGPFSDLRLQVEEFHKAIGQPVLDTPTIPSDDRIRLRLRLVTEEFFELLKACVDDTFKSSIKLVEDRVGYIIKESPLRVDLPEVADALADIDYVNEGFRLELGINGLPIAEAVHISNMSKSGGPVVDGKQKKPEGWTPPDIAGELVKQGWKQ